MRNKKYSAFIFDMDGTMVDNMHYHLLAWKQTIELLGSSLQGEELQKELYGLNTELIERVMGKGKFSEEDLQRIGDEKERLYRLLYKPHLKFIDGFLQFIEKCKQQEIKLGIGTAANRLNTALVVEGLSIKHYFNAIVTGEEVQKGKPDPEVYLKVAEQLQVSPAECVVFEDAPKGVEAAFNAGMDCVAITTMEDALEFSRFKRLLKIITDYKLLNPDDFFNLRSET